MNFFVLDVESKLIKEELFIEKNCSCILENIELLIIESIDIVFLFDRDDLVGMNDIGGRRVRVEYFLKLCNMLLKEKKERVCECLERIFFFFKVKLIYEEFCKLFYFFLFDF